MPGRRTTSSVVPAAVALATLWPAAATAEARACDRDRALSVNGRIVVVTSSENQSCARARSYVRRNAGTLRARGRFFIGRFQCDARRHGARRYRALCGYTASFFRIEYYARGSCGDVTVDETGYIDIRASGMSCVTARGAVRAAALAHENCPVGWRCRHDSASGRTVWTYEDWRISFGLAG